MLTQLVLLTNMNSADQTHLAQNSRNHKLSVLWHILIKDRPGENAAFPSPDSPNPARAFTVCPDIPDVCPFPYICPLQWAPYVLIQHSFTRKTFFTGGENGSFLPEPTAKPRVDSDTGVLLLSQLCGRERSRSRETALFRAQVGEMWAVVSLHLTTPISCLATWPLHLLLITTLPPWLQPATDRCSWVGGWG